VKIEYVMDLAFEMVCSLKMMDVQYEFGKRCI
jgi:hypothetical protein